MSMKRYRELFLREPHAGLRIVGHYNWPDGSTESVLIPSLEDECNWREDEAIVLPLPAAAGSRSVDGSAAQGDVAGGSAAPSAAQGDVASGSAAPSAAQGDVGGDPEDVLLGKAEDKDK